jgi:hypothetical protein
MDIFCPTCNWIISEEEKSFNGLLENRKCTLMAKIITANDMLGRLNEKTNKDQIARLNIQITEWKRELKELGRESIFMDGEMMRL